VEFITLTGQTVAVATVLANQLRAVSRWTSRMPAKLPPLEVRSAIGRASRSGRGIERNTFDDFLAQDRERPR